MNGSATAGEVVWQVLIVAAIMTFGATLVIDPLLPKRGNNEPTDVGFAVVVTLLGVTGVLSLASFVTWAIVHVSIR